MHRLSLSLQHGKHDPVKVTMHLNEIAWTMSKLCLIVENSLGKDDDRQVKTCFKTYLKVKNDDSKFCYQVIKITKCELTIKQAKTVSTSAISNICSKSEQRFYMFVESVVFSNILLLLDTKSWPKDDLITLGNHEINKSTDHDTALLKKTWM